MRNGVDIN